MPAPIKEVYTHFGLAVYYSNCLEQSIINAIVLLTMLSQLNDIKSRAIWTKKYDSCHEKFSRQTLGALVQPFKKKSNLPADIVTNLELAKEMRNTLAHRFFSKHDRDFLNLSGRKAMLLFCKNATLLFLKLDKQIDGYMKPERIKLGLSDDSSGKLYRDYYEQAQTGAYKTSPSSP